jgi:uncharacterized Zn-binding protein involved in type VI secretion
MCAYETTVESPGCCNPFGCGMPACPGTALAGQHNVITNPGLPVVRSSDRLSCCGTTLASGSPTVITVYAPTHRTGDFHPCGGSQIAGSPNVIIGP